jgi:hypothetical protein
MLILQEGTRSSNTESDDGLSEEEELASANRAAGRSAEAGGLAVSRSAEVGGLAVSRSGDLVEEEEEEEEEEDNVTQGESRERSGQHENDPRDRETGEARDSALEEDVSEEEVGGGQRVSICVETKYLLNLLVGKNCCSSNFYLKKASRVRYLLPDVVKNGSDFISQDPYLDRVRSPSFSLIGISIQQCCGTGTVGTVTF